MIKKPWSKWLKETTGYSDVHARKLRILASILHGYPQFYKVGLPFSFIYNKKEKIKEMLKIPKYRDFWKEDLVVPQTAQLQQSQES